MNLAPKTPPPRVDQTVQRRRHPSIDRVAGFASERFRRHGGVGESRRHRARVTRDQASEEQLVAASARFAPS